MQGSAQDRLLQERTFYRKEKKSLPYLIAIMNMMLHGIEARFSRKRATNFNAYLRNQTPH